jgi:hypothetical protein
VKRGNSNVALRHVPCSVTVVWSKFSSESDSDGDLVYRFYQNGHHCHRAAPAAHSTAAQIAEAESAAAGATLTTPGRAVAAVANSMHPLSAMSHSKNAQKRVAARATLAAASYETVHTFLSHQRAVLQFPVAGVSSGPFLIAFGGLQTLEFARRQLADSKPLYFVADTTYNVIRASAASTIQPPYYVTQIVLAHEDRRTAIALFAITMQVNANAYGAIFGALFRALELNEETLRLVCVSIDGSTALRNGFVSARERIRTGATPTAAEFNDAERIAVSPDALADALKYVAVCHVHLLRALCAWAGIQPGSNTPAGAALVSAFRALVASLALHGCDLQNERVRERLEQLKRALACVGANGKAEAGAKRTTDVVERYIKDWWFANDAFFLRALVPRDEWLSAGAPQTTNAVESAHAMLKQYAHLVNLKFDENTLRLNLTYVTEADAKVTKEFSLGPKVGGEPGGRAAKNAKQASAALEDRSRRLSGTLPQQSTPLSRSQRHLVDVQRANDAATRALASKDRATGDGDDGDSDDNDDDGDGDGDGDDNIFHDDAVVEGANDHEGAKDVAADDSSDHGFTLIATDARIDEDVDDATRVSVSARRRQNCSAAPRSRRRLSLSSARPTSACRRNCVACKTPWTRSNKRRLTILRSCTRRQWRSRAPAVSRVRATPMRSSGR